MTDKDSIVVVYVPNDRNLINQFRGLYYSAVHKTDLYKRMIEITPLNKAADASEITGTVVYLASNQSSNTTGTDILVDGGFSKLMPGREKS